jgi:hypothetical protein
MDMTTATMQIFTTLNTMFVELDAKMVRDQKTWAMGRVAAIKEFKASNKFCNEMGRIIDQHGYYTTLFATAGGKTWYNILNGRNEAMINEFVEKNCRAIAEKRNANIARKLNKEGITAVTASEVAYTSDGFNGSFKVETDKGNKIVNIQTIYAGGYNIQCFHQRTLVKVR